MNQSERSLKRHIDEIEKWNENDKIDSENGALIMTVEEIKKNSKIVYNIMQGRPSIKIRLNDLETDCLLDTGARVNVIDSKIIK